MSAKNNNVYTDAILFPIAAALLMHGPGLTVKWSNEEWPEYCQSLLGAIFEGIFLLMLGMRVVHALYCIYENKRDNSSCRDDKKCRRIFLNAYKIISFLSAVWIFAFIFSAIIGDATYRSVSGNVSPDKDVIQAGFGDAKVRVVAEFQTNFWGTIWKFVFGISCLLGSVCVYLHPFRKMQSRYGLQPTASIKYNALTKDINTGLMLTGEINVDEEGGIENEQQSSLFEAEFTSVNRLSKLCPQAKAYLPKSKVLQIYIIVSILGCISCMMNSAGWYTPVLFAYFSLFFSTEDLGSMAGVSGMITDTSGVLPSKLHHSNAVRTRPNIIFIQHESLSGSIPLNTKEGKQSMPFFQDMMHNDPNMFVFEHARAVSVNTIDAMPALMTGCLPYTYKAKQWQHTRGRSIGWDFRKMGYSTASFSSRGLDKSITSGMWRWLLDSLVGGMDKVVDPIRNKMIRDNAEGTDDRRMIPIFEEWLRELGAEPMVTASSTIEKGPFYAQFYNFNQHSPCLKDSNNPSQSHRYYDSLVTTDQFLKSLFEVLKKTGQLENTIIVGSGDHGEDSIKKNYSRLQGLDSNSIQPLTYIYYPHHLMRDASVAEKLRRNTQQLVHTLDIYPTIQSIVRGSYDFMEHASHECITGVDLTSVDIPNDRVLIGWDSVSSGRGYTRYVHMWTLSTRDSTGRDLTLYHRKGKSYWKAMKQGPNNFYKLYHNDCTHQNRILCMKSATDYDKAIFRGAIQWLKHSPLIGEGVRTSELVQFFSDWSGWVETGEMPLEVEMSSGVQEQDSIDTQPNNVQQEDAFDTQRNDESEMVTDDLSKPPQSSSEGFFTSMVHSVQEKIGTRSDDPSCDDILLFMPDMFNSIGSQFNSYFRAAMLATFMNKALVVLDVPQDVTCPSNTEEYRLGLSSIVVSPEWLTRNCLIPCQATHGHAEWSDIRFNSQPNEMFDPVEKVCTNDNGRQSRVFPIGGEMVHEYFENYFKAQMLQLPPASAKDWALRLGAGPTEAEIFSQLSDEPMWDYIGALMVRSGIFQLQYGNLMSADKYVKEHIQSSWIRSRSWRQSTHSSHDNRIAIYIDRGDDILADPEAKSFIVNYWEGRGMTPKSYIPLYYYLRQLNDVECSTNVREIYIATSDPNAIMEEFDALKLSKAPKSHNKARDMYTLGCHKFKVYISKAREPKSDNCTEQHANNVASIAEFIIMQNSGVFVGEFHSDWGKLVRTSRLKLNSDTDRRPVSLKDTRVAWGVTHP